MVTIDKKNMRIVNWWLRIHSYNKKGVIIAKKSNISAITHIGSGTRINGKIVIKGHGEAFIGKYCAIGDGVRIITSNHATNYMNLQIALQHKLGVSVPVDNRQGVEIGHNVWVGDASILLPGVKIGNGAVIAAGAVVTKDVPPFAIFGGNPAKKIRYRFSEENCIICEKLAWWEWDESEMCDQRNLFDQLMD